MSEAGIVWSVKVVLVLSFTAVLYSLVTFSGVKCPLLRTSACISDVVTVLLNYENWPLRDTFQPVSCLARMYLLRPPRYFL